MAIWKLTIEDDEGQKTVVPLVRDEYTIGRREGHTIRLTERNVSRDHARLRKDDDAYRIEDLGAYNGVFVNGHRVAEPQRLQHGDLLLIGDYRIEAHNEEAAGARVVPATSSAPPSKPVTVPPPTVAAKPARAPDAKPHRLVLLTGDDGGKEFPLDKTSMTIGRGEEVDIRINHSSVSRSHCEVTTSDQQFFEVLDSGSANGIRVNGQEVEKALLATGDTLELGDVVLKYVAAGQPFVFDSAEAARAVAARAGSGKKPSPALLAVVGVVVLGAIIAGIVLARGGGKDEGTAASASAAPQGADVLAQPYKLKQDNDIDGAHDGVAGIGKDSPLRKDKRFIEIENAWADKMLASMKKESDADKKRAALKAVLESGADESYRNSAVEMLSDLEKGADAGAPKPPPKATATDTALVPHEPKPTSTAPPNGKPTATSATAAAKPTATGGPQVAAAAGNCPSWKGDYGGAMRAKDYECVRTILLPRLNAGTISQPEARYLKAACAALSDNACQKRAAEKL
jgi:pSer/pThr/pTyr-binding forkhead associated (FHA) protein